jgi:hypothetical protein
MSSERVALAAGLRYGDQALFLSVQGLWSFTTSQAASLTLAIDGRGFVASSDAERTRWSSLYLTGSRILSGEGSS